MADNVKDATFEVLKGIEASIAELRADMVDRFGQVGAGLKKERRNNAGTLVMMRATAGFFEERLTKLEERVEDMQRRAG